MNIHWFKNPDNIAYVKEDDFVKNFSKETGIPDLGEKIRKFRENPTWEGKLLKGKLRTSLKLFIPDLTFKEHLDMGENVWVYMGPNYSCYVLFTPWENDEETK